MSIDPGKNDRVTVSSGIQGLTDSLVAGRRLIALIGHPLIDLQPGPGLAGVARQALLHLAGQLIEVDALALKVTGIQGDGAQDVDMVVMQARQHHLAAQVDHLETLLDKGICALAVTGVDKGVIGHRHGFDLATLAILGIDLAVEVHRVAAVVSAGAGGLAATGHRGEQGKGRKR